MPLLVHDSRVGWRISASDKFGQLLQWGCIVLIDLIPGEVLRSEYQHCTVIPATATIVAGTKDCHAPTLVLLQEAPPIIRKLVTANQEPESVLHAELHRQVWPKLDSNASIRLELALPISWITPQQVREDLILCTCRHDMGRRALMELYGVDVVKSQGANPCQPTMHHKYFFLYDCAKGQALEDVDKAAIDRQVVLPQHLIGKSSTFFRLHRVHVLVLMIPPVDHNALLVSKEEGDEDEQDLHSLRASIRNVAVEQVAILLRRIAQLVKDVQHIIELSMSVANNDQSPGLRSFQVYNGPRVPGLVGSDKLCCHVFDIARVQELSTVEVVFGQALCPFICERYWNSIALVLGLDAKLGSGLTLVLGGHFLSGLPAGTALTLSLKSLLQECFHLV
mmetsp:Transcript_12231/g.27723  ORF Transcript_12231/g.27723 Transcript_12231/m.27723 type:complete len:393 (+) Transcript_12231:1463-2641(+)